MSLSCGWIITQAELAAAQRRQRGRSEADVDGEEEGGGDDDDHGMGGDRRSNPHSPGNVILAMATQEQKIYVKCLRYSDREEDAVEALQALLNSNGHVSWCSKELVRIRAIRRSVSTPPDRQRRRARPPHMPQQLPPRVAGFDLRLRCA